MDEIQALLKQPEKPTRTGGRRKKADPTLTRDSGTWFRLQHTFMFSCDNPECKDPRPKGDEGRNCTTPIPTGVKNDDGTVVCIHICRFCFLEGYGLPGDE